MGPTKQFHTQVITSFLAATVIVTLLSWLVYRLKNGNKFNQGDLLFFMIAVALNQGQLSFLFLHYQYCLPVRRHYHLLYFIISLGGNLRSQSTSFRLIYGSWLLALFVVIILYSGTLTSMMTTPTYKFLVDSVDDLVANEKIKPLILRGSPAYGDVTVNNIFIWSNINTKLSYLKYQLSANIRMYLI